jgi:hypothetical protein
MVQNIKGDIAFGFKNGGFIWVMGFKVAIKNILICFVSFRETILPEIILRRKNKEVDSSEMPGRLEIKDEK